MKKLYRFSLMLFMFNLINFNVLAQSSSSFNYFDYVSNYRADSFYVMSKQEERLEKILLPRLVSVNGNIGQANLAITNYSRNYTSSNLNTSGITNKYNSINDPAGCEIYLNKHWEELGPFGNNTQGRWGQIHNFEYSPDFVTDNTMYACSFYGGVWKSSDRGISWNLLTESRKLPTPGVGDIEIHPLNKDKIFISTGMNSYHAGYTFSASGDNVLYTQGLFRSEDGGINWTEILDDNFWNHFEEGGNITQMYIDPHSTNKNRMIISTSKGAWKCEDISESSPSWSKITTLNTKFYRCVVRDYSSNNHVYLSSEQLTRYNIANGTKQIYNYPIPSNTKVLSSTIRTTPADGSKVYCYVKIAFPKQDSNDNNILDADGNLVFETKASIWKMMVFDKVSNSFIETYTKPNTGQGKIDDCCDRGIFRMPIAVSPFNANTFYFGDRYLFGTSLALIPNTYSDIYNFTYTNNIIHDDIHVISFAPDGSGVYVGSDGGILFKPNITLTNEWEVRHQGINNMLLWAMDDSEMNDEIVLIGAQDNQTFSKVNNNWSKFGNGDGYNVGIDDETPSLSFYRSNGYLTSKNLLTGNTTSETTLIPGYIDADNTGVGQASAYIANHPKSGKLIYAFKNGLSLRKKKYKELGDTSSDLWQAISAIPNIPDAFKFSIAESNPAKIYLANFGRTNFNGSLSNWGDVFYKTTDDGNTWQNLTSNIKSSYNGIHGYWLPHYVVSGVATSTTDAEKIWLSFSGYNDTLKVWSSSDGGLSWHDTDPTNCLPNLPINDIVYQDGTNDRLYIATDVGVYTKDNTSGWERYGDIPNIRVVNLKINRCSGKMKAGTYGRGVWEVDLMPDNGKITNELTFGIGNLNETIWDEDKAVTKNIRLYDHQKLTLDGMTLYMPKNGRIYVGPDATLTLKNGAKITNGCGEMWEGIIVYGYSDQQQPTFSEFLAGTQHHQGVVYMNDATLEHAKEAIRLHVNMDFPNWPQKNSFNGGVVFASNSSFINNRRSAEFMRYTTDASESVFENCEFITNEDYRLEEHTPYHITLWENHGTHILNCKFEDQRTSLSIYDYKRATGIQSIDANYKVSAVCNGIVNTSDPNLPCSGPILANEFIHLRRGIHASGTGAQPSNLQIVDNDFENCIFGVTLEAMDNAAIVKNRFTQTEEIFASDALYLHNSNGATITKNQFEGLRIAMTTNAMGWLSNEVYKNTVSKTSLLQNGYNAVGVETQGYNDKLRIDCNDFNYMYYDFYSLANGSQISLGNQGTNTDPVANTFNNSFTTGVHGYLKASNELIGSYDYTAFSGPTAMNPNLYSPNINTSLSTNSYNTATGCPDKDLGYIVGKNGGAGLSLVGYYSLLNGLDYYNADDAVIIDETINELVNYYLNIKDVGNIIALLAQYPDEWHRVQLASYYTLDGQYTQANTVLTSLIAGDAATEVKDLAELYSIKNNLEMEGKTWFEINATDKDKVKTFALREDDSPATIKSRNVLYLTDNMFFEEKPVFPEMEGTTSSAFNEPEPLFEQYPNPIAGVLNLEYSETIDEPFTVYIYNLLNNTQVYEGQMENNLFTLDVSEWATGFYSIVVKTAQGEEIYKSSTKIKN